jgi:hypothetical protein
MTARRRAGAGLAAAGVAALLVAGCSSGGGSAGEGGTTTTRGKPTTTTSTTRPSSNRDAPGTAFATGWPKGSGGECAGHRPGKGGVLMTFCHGRAKVTVTTPDGPHELVGVCWRDARELEVDAGVTVGEGWDGPWPDYVTFRADATSGDTSNHVVAWIDGTEHLLQDMQGSISLDGKRPGNTIGPAAVAAGRVKAEYEGTDLQRQEIKVSVDC